jgi:hypothetical protein
MRRKSTAFKPVFREVIRTVPRMRPQHFFTGAVTPSLRSERFVSRPACSCG